MTLEKRSIATPAEAQVLPAGNNARYGTVSVFELKNLPERWPDTLYKAPVQFHRVSQDEAELLQAAMEKSGVYPAGDAANRLRAGREAFVGEVEGPGGKIMVTYGWLALTAEPMGSTGWSYEPPPGDAYLYDFATVPEYRGQGFYPALLRYMLAELAKRGIQRAWIGTAAGNFASQKSIERAGFIKVADTHFVSARNGQRAYFELYYDDNYDQELHELARQAHVSNGG